MNLSGLKRLQKFVERRYNCNMSELVAKIKADEFSVYTVLQEFVIHCDKTDCKPNTIKCWMSPAKGFFRQSGIKVYSEDFKQLVRLPKTVRAREEPLTKGIIVRILYVLPLKMRTVIIVAVASGMRIGEIAQLKISDIDFESNPTKVRIRAETTKTKEERETFLTDEATSVLKDFLAKYYGWIEKGKNEHLANQMIFDRTISLPKNRTLKASASRRATGNMENCLRKYLLKVPELSMQSQNGRFQVHFHAFRKFFYTTVSNVVGSDYANALLGHHFYLNTYYNLPEEKRKEMYIKAEPHLTISDYSKVEKDLVVVQEKQKQIESEYYHLLKFFEKNHVEMPKILKKTISDIK